MSSRSITDICQDNERAVIGAGAFAAFLVLWEGFSRGWWAMLFEPLLGESARALAIKPIIEVTGGVVAQAGHAHRVIRLDHDL